MIMQNKSCRNLRHYSNHILQNELQLNFSIIFQNDFEKENNKSVFNSNERASEKYILQRNNCQISCFTIRFTDSRESYKCFKNSVKENAFQSFKVSKKIMIKYKIFWQNLKHFISLKIHVKIMQLKLKKLIDFGKRCFLFSFFNFYLNSKYFLKD